MIDGAANLQALVKNDLAMRRTSTAVARARAAARSARSARTSLRAARRWRRCRAATPSTSPASASGCSARPPAPCACPPPPPLCVWSLAASGMWAAGPMGKESLKPGKVKQDEALVADDKRGDSRRHHEPCVLCGRRCQQEVTEAAITGKAPPSDTMLTVAADGAPATLPPHQLPPAVEMAAGAGALTRTQSV